MNLLPHETYGALLSEICVRYGIDTLYVFGSRAKEIADQIHGGGVVNIYPESDVDIGVLPRDGVKLSAREKVCLMADLEDLFEAGRVDLVVLPEVSIFLALEVIQGETLYDRDPDPTSEFELYVMRRAGDLSPFDRERMEQILTGNAS